MTNPYPLPRETRETPIIAGDGRATYGPFGFRIWDGADVSAVVSRQKSEFLPEPVTASKANSDAFAFFNVTFAPPLATGDRAIVRSTRLHERQSDVTRGGSISGIALERELSVQATVLQELRRDDFRHDRDLHRERSERMAVDKDLGDRIVSAEQVALDRRAAEEAALRTREALSDIVAEKEVPIFSSRATVIATGIPAGLAAFRTNGFERTGDGGAPLYTVQDTKPPEKGAFFIPAISKWAKLCEDGVRPQFFGAKAGFRLNGAGSMPGNGAAMQEWLDYLQSSTQPGSVTHLTAKEGYLPAGGYLIDQTLLLRRPIGLRGDGGWRSIIYYEGPNQALIGEFKDFDDTQDIWGMAWKGIGFHPRYYGGGGIGILLNIAYSLSMLHFDDVMINDFGNKGLYLVNSEGIFTGGGHEILVENSYIQNGVRFINLGDSLKFRNNYILSARNLIGIEGDQIAGAAQVQIESNVIVCRGGTVQLNSCHQPHIRQLWAEQPTNFGSFNGDPNVQRGLVTLNGCDGATVTDCTFNPLHGYDGHIGIPYSVALDSGCNNAKIEANSVSIGSRGYIDLGNAPRLSIGPNYAPGQPESTQLYANVHKSTRISGQPLLVKADRNGTNLLLGAGADTRLSFTNVAPSRLTFTDSRWTPPKATVRIAAAFRVVEGDVSGDFAEIAIFKNGSEFRRSAPFARASAGVLGASIEATDEASGTDYYDVYVFVGGGGTGSRTVSGLTHHTYFAGSVQQ